MAGDDWMTPEHKAAALEGFRGNPVAMAYARAQSRPTLISWLEDCIAQDMTVAQEQRRFEQYVEGTGRMFAVSHALVGMAPHRAVAECEAKLRLLKPHRARQDWFGRPDVTHPRACHGCYSVGDDPATPDADECPTARLLALPYADWRGYREEWKP